MASTKHKVHRSITDEKFYKAQICSWMFGVLVLIAIAARSEIINQRGLEMERNYRAMVKTITETNVMLSKVDSGTVHSRRFKRDAEEVVKQSQVLEIVRQETSAITTRIDALESKTRRLQNLISQLQSNSPRLRGEPGPPGADGLPGPMGPPGISGDTNSLLRAPTVFLPTKRMSLFEGVDAQFRCNATGNPLPEISWVKAGGDERAISRGNGQAELVIEKVTSRDAGKYICIAKSILGEHRVTAELSVKVRPRITVPLPLSVYAESNKTYTFPRCEATGDPAPVISWPWRKTSAGTKLPSDHVIMDGRLTLFDIQTDESGSYVCEAKNELGSAMTATTLVVLETLTDPVFAVSPPEELSAFPGQTVRLDCSAFGFPSPTVRWKKDGSVIASEKSDEKITSNTVMLANGSLLIYNISTADYGHYACEAMVLTRNASRITELTVNECLSNPCLQEGKCNERKHGYFCSCPKGYTGQQCEIDIDDCAVSPCQSGGVCQDSLMDYICICPFGYYGKNCQFTGDDFYQIYFPTKSTKNYVQIGGLGKPLRAFTVCMWFKSLTDRAVLFSYATQDSKSDIKFEVKKSHFKFHVHNKNLTYVPLPKLTDDNWHILCGTWETNRGRWTAFQDGRLIGRGIGHKKGKLIRNDGVIILGQDQELIETGFPRIKSYHGALTGVNMWKRAMSGDFIKMISKDCGSGQPGNLLSWGDFRVHRLGKYTGHVRTIEYLPRCTK